MNAIGFLDLFSKEEQRPLDMPIQTRYSCAYSISPRYRTLLIAANLLQTTVVFSQQNNMMVEATNESFLLHILWNKNEFRCQIEYLLDMERPQQCQQDG